MEHFHFFSSAWHRTAPREIDEKRFHSLLWIENLGEHFGEQQNRLCLLLDSATIDEIKN